MNKLKHKTTFTFQFNYKGEELEVHGTYTPADYETRDTPGTNESFEIDKCVFLGTEEEPIEMDMEQLEEFILEKYF